MGRRSKTRDRKNNEANKINETANNNENNQTITATFIDRYDWEKLSYFVGIITVILSGGYVIVNNIYMITYQRDCEEFYKLPGKYFYNNIDIKAIYVIALILCIFIFFTPSIIKRNMQKRDGYKKFTIYIYILFLTLILGLVLGLINTLNLVTVLEKINTIIEIPNDTIQWINDHASLIMWIVVVLATLTILMFCLAKEVGKIRFKKIKALISIIGIASYFITAVLFISAAEIKLTYSVKDKVQYETVNINNKNMVVLSTIDDKFLVVEYSLKDGQVTFITNKYMIIDNSNIMIAYKEFESMPHIK
ncbi:MAG: hypothetical protein PHF63_05455 [Herbinix sp.]|nr:hypothetical protein [Herbinix sp.]